MMNDIWKYVGSFAAGATCGALVGALLAKKKYRSVYEKAAESVTEYVNARKDIEPVDESIEMPDPADVFEAIEEEDTSLKDELNRLTEKYRTGMPETPIIKNDIPYLIEPEMFGEDSEYEQISLTYYADGKLADSDDDLVENLTDVVGKEWRERFDKYDEDIVYVCNDARKCYYEITRDYRKYMDILEERPYLIHNVFDVPQDEGE